MKISSKIKHVNDRNNIKKIKFFKINKTVKLLIKIFFLNYKFKIKIN